MNRPPIRSGRRSASSKRGIGMRPLDSHHKHGHDAYLEGADVAACPHAADTLKHADWTIGWLQAAVADPLAGDPDLEDRTEDFATQLDALRAARRARLQSISAALPKARDVAKLIGIPLKEWPGQCHAIATALQGSGLLKPISGRLGRARVAYGIYRGPIAPESPFSRRPFSHHGWIEFESGLIVDPTRWVFESAPPALAAVSIDDYDLAGRFTRAMMTPRVLPQFDESQRVVTWDVDDADITNTVKALLGASGEWDRRIGLAQMVWLGNLALETLGPHASQIFDFFSRKGLISLVPIDHRSWVEEPAAEASWPQP